MGMSKPSTPPYPPRKNKSPNKIEELKKEFKFKGNGSSLNGSFQGADESYISNPSIMENEGEQLMKITHNNTISKTDMRLSGFGNFYHNQLKTLKPNVKVVKRRSSQVYYQEKTLSNMRLHDISDKKIPGKQRYYSPYQGARKCSYKNIGNRYPMVDKNFRRSSSIAKQHKEKHKKNTRISLFGRVSPKNTLHGQESLTSHHKPKLTPLYISKEGEQDSDDSDCSDDSLTDTISNQIKKRKNLLSHYQSSSASSISSYGTGSLSIGKLNIFENDKLEMMMLSGKKLTKKPSIDQRTSIMASRGMSKIFKGNRLDVTMNNLDIKYVGDYHLLSLIGKGSFAKVVKAAKSGCDQYYVRNPLLRAIGYQEDQ